MLSAQEVSEWWEDGPIMKKIAKAFEFAFFKSVYPKIRGMTSWELAKMIHLFSGKQN